MGYLHRRRLAREDTGPHQGRPLRSPPTRSFATGSRRTAAPGPQRRRRLPGRARPLSSLCLARLPVGAPHHHLPQAQEARERHLDVGHVLAHGQGRLDLRPSRRLDRRHRQRQGEARRTSICRQAALHRPRHRAGAVGQGAQDHRQQRVVRNHPHAQFGVRRVHQRPDRLLSAALRAEIDRINDLVYPNVNNGVYRSGFATTQDAYEEAFRALFETLDELEQRLVASSAISPATRSPRPTGGCSRR